MPNHVTNLIKLKGPKSDIEALKAAVRSEDSPFDFNKIHPMPKELEDTRSPAKIISEEEYLEQEARRAKGELTKMEEAMGGISRGLTEELFEEYKEKFGAADWYNWHCNNWGTKWNAYDLYQEWRDNNSIQFDTAWSPPMGIIAKLTELFPAVSISIKWSDEDLGYNVGHIEVLNGSVVTKNVPKGNSDEAWKIIFEIKPYLKNEMKKVNGEWRYDDE